MTDSCLPRPSPSDVYKQISDLFSSNVLGGAPVIPESNEWFLINNDYASAELFYSIAAQNLKEQDDRVNCCDSLVDRSAQVGLYPMAQTFARGYVKLTGIGHALIPPNLSVTFGNKIFLLESFVTQPSSLSAEGQAIVLMQALVPGVSSNTAIKNQVGVLTTPVTGIDNDPTLYGTFCGGKEAEDCETFRKRVLYRKQYQPVADFAWIVQKAKLWPCLTRVCVRKCNDCCEDGVMRLFAFFDDSFEHGIPPQQILIDLTKFIFGSPQGMGYGQAPIGLFGQFYAAGIAPLDITIQSLSCVSSQQLGEITRQIKEMFKNICPGNSICLGRYIDAIIISNCPSACNYTIKVTSSDGTAQIDCNSDIKVGCDYLPILNSLVFV